VICKTLKCDPTIHRLKASFYSQGRLQIKGGFQMNSMMQILLDSAVNDRFPFIQALEEERKGHC
jgi:hypothetical protein